MTKEQVPAATTRPAVAAWTAGYTPSDEVNLLVMGDWGSNSERQREVAETLGDYAKSKWTAFNALLTAGDNFYVKLKNANDPNWQNVFEYMYDATKVNFPFYATLGNHDYESGKRQAELDYAIQHPDSRWKMPARWYRLDLPEQNPLATVLMLDSNWAAMSDADWKAQSDWIDAELSKPRSTKWTILVAHHTIFSNGDHGDSWMLERDWGELLKKHKVDFYVCGHDHALQHLEIPQWPTSFVVAGGGGQTRRAMRRDDRGPFSRKLYGFAHLKLTGDSADVSLIDGLSGQVVHEFTRSAAGQTTIVRTTPSDTVAKYGSTVAASGRPNSPALRALSASGDDYQRMTRILSFTTEQRAAFDTALAVRNQGYDTWARSAEGKDYAAAQRNLSQAKRTFDQQREAEAQKTYDRLRKQQEEVRLNLRREFNKAIDFKQQQRWAGYMLYKAVIDQFKDASPSDEQKQQAFAACVAIATQAVDEPELQRNPYLNPDEKLKQRAIDVIRDHIMTTVQRKKLEESFTPTTPSDTPAEASMPENSTGR